MYDYFELSDTEPVRELSTPLIDVAREGVVSGIERVRSAVLNALSSQTSVVGRIADILMDPDVDPKITTKFGGEPFPPDMNYYGGPSAIKTC